MWLKIMHDETLLRETLICFDCGFSHTLCTSRHTIKSIPRNWFERMETCVEIFLEKFKPIIGRHIHDIMKLLILEVAADKL